jgi:hypothetical protein
VRPVKRAALMAGGIAFGLADGLVVQRPIARLEVH